MNVDLEAAKQKVHDFHCALENATSRSIASVMSAHLAPDCVWRAVDPFGEGRGVDKPLAFWIPFLEAFGHVQRREDVLMAGLNEIDGFASTWVCSMGHLMGLFDRPWLGIRPTRRMALLRYAEFYRVEECGISEVALFCDILHLMQQVGQYPLPTQTGAHLVQPGPQTHDGVMRGPQDPSGADRTLSLINAMVFGINHRERFSTPQEELRQFWHDDMIWWGPAGIGASYTIERYIEQHQAPFRTGFDDRKFNGHLCRFAEGCYGGFFGWPNLTLTPTGGFMGLPASAPADMRVVDIYRREGDKLAENWVFIDMVHFLKMQGLDVLARLETAR